MSFYKKILTVSVLLSVISGIVYYDYLLKRCAREHQFGLDDGLWHAAWAGDIARMQELLDAGANINYQDGFDLNETALHWAVYADDAAAVSFLLEHGARTDIKSVWGKTPLDVAKSDAIAQLLRDAQSRSISAS